MNCSACSTELPADPSARHVVCTRCGAAHANPETRSSRPLDGMIDGLLDATDDVPLRKALEGDVGVRDEFEYEGQVYDRIEDLPAHVRPVFEAARTGYDEVLRVRRDGRDTEPAAARGIDAIAVAVDHPASSGEYRLLTALTADLEPAPPRPAVVPVASPARSAAPTTPAAVHVAPAGRTWSASLGLIALAGAAALAVLAAIGVLLFR